MLLSESRFPLRFALVAAACLLLASGWGCARSNWVRVRCQPSNPLTEELSLLSRRGPQVTPRTQQLARRLDLPNPNRAKSDDVLAPLQEEIERSPDCEKIYAMAEIAYLGAAKRDRQHDPQALHYYMTAAAHAYLYLFDERFASQRNAYDPQYRGACDLYNQSLEGALRLLYKDRKLVPGVRKTIQSHGQDLSIDVVLRSLGWKPSDFAQIAFTSDYEVKGLKNHYRTFGLGVPLIVIRPKKDQQAIDDKYYPEKLSFAATAFLRLLPCSDGSGKWQALLELYDPLETSEIVVQNTFVPLETDITTPLAYFLNETKLNRLAIQGLIHPGRLLMRHPRGLQMIEPYDPNKIPVIMVHGLWSSPLTWMEMFNDLRALPEIRRRYQFWFYLYPSGEPFLASAARLREDLAEVRMSLDPRRENPAMDQMVLVGHSMGGLVARLQTVDSGNDFWKAVSKHDFSKVRGDPEQIGELRKRFFFEANPDVKRVVTLGTPYGGSRFVNGATRWLSRKLIALPDMVVNMHRQLAKQNPDLFTGGPPIPTSIDMLSPNSPFLSALKNARRAPWVSYHNVVGDAPGTGFGEFVTGRGDGVVPLTSARTDDARSEIVVPADHVSVHRHPRSILETQRVLTEHLNGVDQFFASIALDAHTVPRAMPVAVETQEQAHPPAEMNRGESNEWEVSHWNSEKSPFAPPPAPVRVPLSGPREPKKGIAEPIQKSAINTTQKTRNVPLWITRRDQGAPPDSIEKGLQGSASFELSAEKSPAIAPGWSYR